MGNVTAKTSGEIASFMSPAKTHIKSLKVHFSPKQLGTGNPSPENVREIEGWDGVEVNGSGKNIAHIVGYSAKNSDSNNSRSITNSYGTTINTTEFILPDTKLVVTQTQSPNTSNIPAYQNGYLAVLVDNLVWGQKYNISFKIENIINNPLNAEIKDIKLLNPFGTFYSSVVIDDNHVVFKKVLWKQYSNTAINRRNFEIRNCGMSFTLSEFMITPVDEDNFEYEPYQGNIISYQWKLPDEYQEVEYIENNDNAYLDLNYIPTGKEIFEISFSYIKTPSTSQYLQLFGCRNQTVVTSNQNCWLGISYNDILFSRFGTVNITNPPSLSKGDYTIKVDLNNTELKINNDIYSFNGSIISDISNTIYLGYLNAIQSSLRADGIARYKYFKIFNNKTIIKFLIPCYRKLDGEIGMYDTVSQTFYTNQGTGEFLKGDDVFCDTAYGGYVDLISGELVEESKLWTKNTSEMNSNNSSFSGWWNCGFKSIIGEVNRAFNLKTNSSYMLNVGTYFSANTTGNYDNLYLPNSTYNLTQDEWKEKAIDVKIVAPLTTPIIHQLTPTQLSSFIGQNNFWSNADYVEIEYDLIETEDIQKCRKKIMLNQPHTESATGDIASFTTNMKAPLKECKVYFNPIQEGSGDPSPDNVRNIVGWDGIEVNSCGKNLWNNEDIIYGYWTDSNGKQSVNQRGCRTQYIYVTSNTTIQLFYYGVQPYSASIIELNDNKEFIKRTHIAWEGVTNPKSLTITTSNETKYIYAQTYTYTSSSNNKMTYDLLCSYKMQMEFNTITSYEPYKGNIYSEDWSSEVGTVYGGYVDLAKGELVATHKFVIYNGQEDGWNTYYVSHQIHFTRVISDKKIKMNSSISNLFPNANNIVFGDRKEYSVFGDHNTLPRIYVNAPYEMPNGVTEWKEWLSANPLQVCYELAEPIHYSLTPQQLLTFKGENNIWSDTNGQTEVKFWTH